MRLPGPGPSAVLSRQADIALLYRLLDETKEISGDFLETIDIGTDRLIPVFAVDLADRFGSASAVVDIPYIAYPADVFLGEVMARKILPLLRPMIAMSPKAETALTHAAVEMAAVGGAVAWVPKSVALERILNGSLVDLSDAVPSCELQVRAVRIQGKPSAAEAALWAQLTRLGV